MSDADTAFAKAQEEIAEAARTGAKALDFSDKDALDRLPPEIADLTGLQTLSLNNTQITDLAPLAGLTGVKVLNLDNTRVTDLAPLAGLTGLQALYLNNTRITDLAPLASLRELLSLTFINIQAKDLRPIARLSKLGTTGMIGYRGGAMVFTRLLEFQNTQATKRDSRLAELAQIEDDRERTRETLAYLQSLPPWPQPYTPAATPDGSPPQPIGRAADPPKVKTPKAQIRHLLHNPVLTRLTAQQFANQIRTALRDVPATNGNYLAEPLQTMLEFAEALELLAPSSESAAAPLEKAKLELRIAQLEELVTRLTQQLQDETNAREAAEALAGKGEFGRSFKKAAGLAAGTAAVGVMTVGVPTAVVYFLGREHPLIQSFLTVLGRLPK